MKLITWNVNGLRACMDKGFLDYVNQEQPDAICLQETKMQEGQAEVDMPEFAHMYYSSAEKKGYSGTAIYAKEAPMEVQINFGLL